MTKQREMAEETIKRIAKPGHTYEIRPLGQWTVSIHETKPNGRQGTIYGVFGDVRARWSE